MTAPLTSLFSGASLIRVLSFAFSLDFSLVFARSRVCKHKRAAVSVVAAVVVDSS